MTKTQIDTVGVIVREGPEVLRNYLRSLYWLWMASSPVKGRDLDAETRRHGRPGSQTPTRPIAGGRMDQEISWLRRQTKDIEVYLNDPSYVPGPGKAKKRCANCKRGLSRSWVYCPMCGSSAAGGIPPAP